MSPWYVGIRSHDRNSQSPCVFCQGNTKNHLLEIGLKEHIKKKSFIAYFLNLGPILCWQFSYLEHKYQSWLNFEAECQGKKEWGRGNKTTPVYKNKFEKM